MQPARTARQSTRQDHAACSGCTLCVPVCPVWRNTRDLRMSPEGRNKALQHGALIGDIAPSVEACTFCGACEPVCPEKIDLLGSVRRLRRQLPDSAQRAALLVRLQGAADTPVVGAMREVLLIPGAALRASPALFETVTRLLGADAAGPVGDDLSLAFETGLDIPDALLGGYLSALDTARRIIVADGLMFSHLRAWRPHARLATLGEVLSGQPAVRALLSPGDLYLIESRAYHADYERLVMHYHRLREERGIHLNLDLQRIAVPASGRDLSQRLGASPPDDAAHVQWLLKGRQVSRVVAEGVEDLAAFKQHSDVPVLHIAELANADARKR